MKAENPNKYRSKPVYRTPDGRYVGRDYPGPKKKAFDSRAEFKRWLTLRELERAGAISGLQLQKTFTLRGLGGRVVCRYKADFVYIVRGVRVVEDVKSKATTTRLYKVKKKLMFDNYGITIQEFTG